MLCSHSRKRKFVEPRFIAYYLLKNNTNESLEEIGFQMGGFDHATVLNGLKTISNLMETNQELKLRVENLQRMVKGWNAEVGKHG